MPNIEFEIRIRGAGMLLSGVTTETTSDSVTAYDPAVLPAKAGELTTRTDNETGEITMAAGGHGITTAQVVDLYWDGGARYGITVGTVAGTTVPIGADNSGTGDNLPLVNTDVLVAPQTTVAVVMSAAPIALGVQMLHASDSETAVSHVSLLDSGDAEVGAVELIGNDVRAFNFAGGDTIFTSDAVASAIVSTAATSAAQLKMIVADDATP